MSSLVEQVLDLEKEANAVVEHARAEARRIEQGAEDEVVRLKQEVSADIERRIAEFRRQAEQRHALDIEQATLEAKNALDVLEGIDTQALQRQVDRVVDQFLGL